MDKIDRTTKYAKQVLSGNIVAGKLVRLACERHMNDLKRSKTRAYPYKFDEDRAERYLDFFKLLKHSKGEWAGQSIELELWQCFCIGSTFGWIHKKTELRRFKTVYEQVARKNGKSTKMAGIGIIGLSVDGEQGAEVYSAATKRDQSRIIFDEAKRMIQASPYIKKHIDVFQANMSMPATNSKFEPLSADANTMDGLNISMGLIDELHAHKTREVYDVLETATGARKQPLIWNVTTAGFNLHGICYELYEYSIKVLEGVIEDETFFAYIAQLDEDDDPFDEANWIKANPNLDISVDMDDLRRKAEKAKEIPAAQNNFFCKHLNMWVNQETRWVNMQKYKVCEEANADFDINQLEGADCYCGIDLSTTTDITSVNLEFPLADGKYAWINHSFIPEDAVREKERTDKVPYSAWIREGWMTATPGSVIDYDWILSYITEQAKKYRIVELDYDPWNATQFANNASNEGFICIEIRQGYRTLSEPTKDVEKLILEKKLLTFGNPVLKWAMNNVVVRLDPAGNVKPDKSKAAQRIDPVMAGIISHTRAMLNPGAVDLNALILSDDWSL
ncbi:putative terminase large subunit 2 [Peptoclostridium acidaminophilum DSM 3953]|uniref:Putative terminase large subunit 2 n=1 Tax=Peptoclostridium acidaminophilum DSM 3953 TaxID=1286171 RepID=W8U652_PEPAC|nr:terminase TerL endonuclease subunit [Peptoclostridium acidaminophilum]AHM56401.1 putative terminase large subunit 2 [Peptoclostridium acidaminophilum DSM 3953]